MDQQKMDREQIRQIIYQELPDIVREDPALQEFILQLVRRRFADKEETESRFEQLLEELRADREEQGRQWRQQEQRWRQQEQRWQQQERLWEQQEQHWEQQEQRWERNQETIESILAEIQHLHKRHDSTIGALGARWGLHSEAAFRNGLRGILQDSFDVDVLHVNEFDESGEVFGRPEQIELDLIVRNGTLIIAEIKSAMSQADMYTFARKAAFYEKLHQREAARKLVISPMVDERAQRAAQKLGIEVFSYADDVTWP